MADTLDLKSSALKGVSVRLAPAALSAALAQLVEHSLCKRQVVGSNPTGGSRDPIVQRIEQVPSKD